MSYRSEIEHALDEIILYQEGMRFQAVAVLLAKRRWPSLVAFDWHRDGGLDAFLPAAESPYDVNVGISCSVTADWTKVDRDMRGASEHHPPLGRLEFMTPRPVERRTQERWEADLKIRYGAELTVRSREDIVADLQSPENEHICRDILKIAAPYELSSGPIGARLKEAAAEVAAAWAGKHGPCRGRYIEVAASLAEGRSEVKRVSAVLGLLSDMARPGARISIEAPAGRGKTSTLVEFARKSAGLRGAPARGRPGVAAESTRHPFLPGRAPGIPGAGARPDVLGSGLPVVSLRLPARRLERGGPTGCSLGNVPTATDQ